MLAKNYKYDIQEKDSGFVITLTCIDGKFKGRSKVFILATGRLDGITQHMKSLTDICCDDAVK